MTSEKVNYRLYNAFIRSYFQSPLNIYPLLASTKQNQFESFNRAIYRTIHQWHDARNVDIENLPIYKSIAELTSKHWDKLTKSILEIHPYIIEDFLQHKMSILYL